MHVDHGGGHRDAHLYLRDDECACDHAWGERLHRVPPVLFCEQARGALLSVDADGTKGRQSTLPKRKGLDDYPDVSPDGRRIALAASRHRHGIGLLAADIRDCFEVRLSDVTMTLGRVEAEMSAIEVKVGPHWGHNWRGNLGNRGEPKRRETAGQSPFQSQRPW
jgi:hypothetical protein